MKKNTISHIIRIIGISIILLSFASPYAFAWTRTMSFESGAEGSIAQGTGLLDYAGSVTTLTTTRARTGTGSARMAWTSGMNGWGTCHGEINFPSNVTEGGEVWFRAYTYFESGWQWNTAPTKFMRLKTAGGHLGLMATNGYFWLSNEVTPYDSSWQSPVQKTPTPIGEWVCLEIYVRFSATDGIIRLWENGVLFAEDQNPTLDAGNTGYLAYLMNTWNSPGAAGNQVQYFDDIVLTNERPSNRDAAGNYMVGPIGWSGGTITDTTPPGVVDGVNVHAVSQ